MGAGRPKSDKPTKDVITSVRLTKDQRDEIILFFGSVQSFLDVAIVRNINRDKKKELDK